MTLEFDNKVFLLTGASQGIGKALAQNLAQAGAVIGLVARNEAALRELARDLREKGGRAMALPADVTCPEAVLQVIQRAESELGPLEVLINAAGVQAPIGLFADNELEAWEYAFKVNLFGAVRVIHRVLPHMIARGRGKIINFSGGGATAPRPHFSAYAASKSALVRFTETLAIELKPHNIQVNSVAPGAINTRMLEEVLAAGERSGEEYRQAQERKESGGTPVALVCELVKFLASPASGSLTGKLISAPHDPWREWAGKAETLNVSPMFTLRRLDPFTIKPMINKLD
jgi:NAD(P)-dependent dehydrogenase (short-subunit alcohol dehydrogenase family)